MTRTARKRGALRFTHLTPIGLEEEVFTEPIEAVQHRLENAHTRRLDGALQAVRVRGRGRGHLLASAVGLQNVPSKV